MFIILPIRKDEGVGGWQLGLLLTVSRILLVINSFNGMELTCGDSNSPSRKPSIPIGVFWYLLPYSHYAQATGSGRKLSMGTDPALPSLAISLGLGTSQVPLQGSRRAHPRLGLAPCEAAIPGSGSGKREAGSAGRATEKGTAPHVAPEFTLSL